MNKSSAVALALFCLLPINLRAAEQDAAGCKDHPLLPRLKDYHIAACGGANASFDLETSGANPETIHIEGDSWAIAYAAPAALEPRPGREQILRRFEKAVKKHQATLAGMAGSMPVYKLTGGGKEIWVVVMADEVGGGYGYRIIEREAMTSTRTAVEEDRLGCARQYGPPLFAPFPGYEICGCGAQDSGAREFRTEKGETIRVEGRVTQMSQCPKEEGKALGDAQIRSRFQKQINKRGGTFVGHGAGDPRIDVYKLDKEGRALWVEVLPEGGGNYSYVVTGKGN